MSVIWSGVTEEGAVVPVQVTDEGKVVAIGDGPQGDYLPITGGTLTGDLNVADGINFKIDGSADFAGSISVNGYDPSTNTDVDGAYIYPSGAYYVNRTSSNTTVFRSTLSNVEKAVIKGDGSAEFAGDVGVGFYGKFGANYVGAGLQKNGSLILYKDYVSSSPSTVKVIDINSAGNDTGGTYSGKAAIYADGSATFAGVVDLKDGATTAFGARNTITGFATADRSGIYHNFYVQDTADNSFLIDLALDGSAVFSGDVVIGSRGEKWLIRESNGVAMLVQQSREAVPMIPEKVRDIPNELDLIEMALNEVMEKLRMTPPAGWPVWDGSDNP